MEQQNERRNDQHGPTSQHNESQKFPGDSNMDSRNEDSTKRSNPEKELKEIYRTSEEHQFQEDGMQGGYVKGDQFENRLDQNMQNSENSRSNQNQNFESNAKWNQNEGENAANQDKFGERTQASHTDDSDFGSEDRDASDRNNNFEGDSSRNNELEK